LLSLFGRSLVELSDVPSQDYVASHIRAVVAFDHRGIRSVMFPVKAHQIDDGVATPFFNASFKIAKRRQQHAAAIGFLRTEAQGGSLI
jgi:hypothetical protein